MSQATTSALVTLVVVLLVIARFLARELRARTIESGWRLWGRPVFLAAVLAYLCTVASHLGTSTAALIASALPSIVLGVIVGVFVVRSTSLTPGPRPGTLIARGSWITVGIWIGALLLRFAARFMFAKGQDPATQMTFNVGALAMVTAAFAYVAIAFSRAQARLRA